LAARASCLVGLFLVGLFFVGLLLDGETDLLLFSEPSSTAAAVMDW